uniref:Secreted protein n=1 Tax=Aegilops tauschii subsp. strangulata TaxID=200361 RepID=A0A453HQH3_AEGTS
MRRWEFILALSWLDHSSTYQLTQICSCNTVSWSSGGAWARIMEGLMAWGGGGGKQNHYRLIFGEKIGLKLRYIHIFSCELGGPPPRLAPMKLRH